MNSRGSQLHSSSLCNGSQMLLLFNLQMPSVQRIFSTLRVKLNVIEQSHAVTLMSMYT